MKPRQKTARCPKSRLTFAAPVANAPPSPLPTANVPQGSLPPMQQADNGPADSLLTFSPNVDELDFDTALARVRSPNHKAFKKIVQHIGEQVGLKPKLADALGDWSDGAENSILQHIDAPIDRQTADYLAAWYGLLGNQKAVLAFTPAHNGPDSVYQIELPTTDLRAVRQSLDKAGIPFRTLVPGKKGTKIVIYDESNELRSKVSQWAGQHNASIRESNGQGRFIGGSTRTAARREYRKIITAYESAATKSGGKVRAYKPPVLPNHLRTPDAPVQQSKRAAKVRLGLEFSKVNPLHDVSIPRDTYSPKSEVSRIVAAFRALLGRMREGAEDAWKQAGKRNRKPFHFSGVRSPAGGVIVRGLYYKGGKFIPSANLEKASYSQYEDVERQKAKRRADHSIDTNPAPTLREKYARRPYTPGVDPRVEKIRGTLGRGGYSSPPPSSGPKPASGYSGSTLPPRGAAR